MEENRAPCPCMSLQVEKSYVVAEPTDIGPDVVTLLHKHALFLWSFRLLGAVIAKHPRQHQG
jgi:hypothetical protein